MQLFELAWKTAYVESQIDFKLRDQFAYATQSVSANIAEGYGRRSVNEYIQFLYVSLGSLAETLTRAIGLQRTCQIPQTRFEEFNQLHYEVENRLFRLIEKLKKSARSETGRPASPRMQLTANHYSRTPPLQLRITPPL